MAGHAPKTKDWTARENAHQPSGLHVIVSGAVEVSDANMTPVLAEGSGGLPGTLALDLAVEACSDPAIDAKVWKAASFHKVVTANQYNRVLVRWQGEQIAATPVIDDKEYGALIDKQTKAQNVIVPKAVKVQKAAAKKPAAGKPEAVKKAAKKVVKAAKKAKKKVAKKVTKKVAKKAAKKSALKKLVRKLVKKLTPKKKDRKGKRR